MGRDMSVWSGLFHLSVLICSLIIHIIHSTPEQLPAASATMDRMVENKELMTGNIGSRALPAARRTPEIK